MHATDFYASVCRCVMQSDPDDAETLVELRRLLPCLRQALGCYVCFSLLNDPMGPSHNVCRHSVCRKCIGGKMRLKPACSWCKDHQEFVPNPLLKTLVTCFKKLCIYIYNSPLGSYIQKSSINGETNHLMQILQEGMDFEDNYSFQPPTTQAASAGPACTSMASTSSDEASTEILRPVEMSDKKVSKDEELFDKQDSTSGENKNIGTTVSDVTTKSVRRFSKLGKKRKNAGKIHDHNYDNKKPVDSVTKPRTFCKRAAAKKKSTNRMSLLKKSLPKHGVKRGKKRELVKKFNLRNSSGSAPSDLERMDKNTPSLKKGQAELLPPELKPLSSCNCGKAGNFNQLTCIGQRCPCYSMKLPCVSCKCRGCRNPKKGPDYQGMFHLNSTAVLRSGTRSTAES